MPRPRSLPGIVPGALSALAVLLGGCASGGKLTHVWTNPAWTPQPMQNVYVVAIRTDPIRRRMWEDGFVAGLARYGVRATPSYTKYLGTAPDTAQVISEVRANGYDGVLVSRRLPDQSSERVLGAATRTDAVTTQDSFTGFYQTTLQEVELPGRVETTTYRIFETAVWSTAPPARQAWSGMVTTDESITTDLVGKVASHTIVDRMARDGVLPAKAVKDK
jgi:hypothetical protein